MKTVIYEIANLAAATSVIGMVFTACMILGG
jgi:hypothetical protein